MASTRLLRPIGQEKLGNLQAWFPRDRSESDPPQDDTFEIGLSFAGGQSAGCYLAGVLDFLFEALDAWEQARKADPAKYPNHKVRIKIIAGASAGGLNTALAAIAGRYRFEPARHAKFEDGDKNLGSPFYRAWVRDVDIRHLLTTDDLGSSGSFSVLNTQYLDQKVANYLDFKGDAPTKRDWLDDPLPFAVMISNVDGVPYRIKFRTEDDNDASANAYWMTQHGDRLAFLRPLAADAPQPTRPDSDTLSLDNSSAADDWKRLGQAVLATIAFPLALRERIIGRPTTDYDYRFAYPFDPGGLVWSQPFPGEPEEQRSFVTIDGGVTDNEPFEIAHAALAGTDGRNVREGDKAKRAVILTAPFVSPKPVRYGVPDTPLPTLFGNIFNALIAQSRFKLMDVSLAANEDIYSRFMIAPVRVQQPSGKKIRGDAALASHPLTSFFGYFSERYRHHDFMLGRLNCYLFLRDWFVLPSTHAPGRAGLNPALGNTLFANWPDAALADPRYKSQSPHVEDHRQIIPLVGTAAQPPESYRWPAGQFAGYAAVESDIKRRVDAVYPLIRDRALAAAIRNGFFRWITRLALGAYWWISGRGAVLGALQQMIDKAREQIDDDRQ
jgi:Patatin-like phospholipase